MATSPLTVGQLRRLCDPDQFKFKTTEEISAETGIFGQPRAVRALEFGVGIRSHGYNIFVIGEPDVNLTKAISRYLKESTREQKLPWDWVYVHNFKIPHQPRAIEFPAGQGPQFKKQLEEFVTSLREELPRAFSTPEYEEEVDMFWNRVELKQNLLMHDLERKARAASFSLIRTASGLTVTPAIDGEMMTGEQFASLSVAEQGNLDQNQQELELMVEDVLKRTRQVKQDARSDIQELDRRVARQSIAIHVEALIEMYKDHEEVLMYLAEVHDDVLANLDDFRSIDAEPRSPADISRYDVNMFVDNSRTDGPPIIVEQNPTYNSLMGRIEYELRDGMMSTGFTNIKPGSLHQSNGGYLIIDALDLLNDLYAWDALKRSIKGGEIVLKPTNMLDGGGRVLAKSIDPEAIPLDVKVLLIGNASVYYRLFEEEEDFIDLFKVKVDFSTEMVRDAEHEMEYAKYIATRCHEDKLSHFTPGAVARLVEFGSEMSEHQNRLSTEFSVLSDLIHEAYFWASQRNNSVVTREDVQKALDERAYRSNKIEMLVDDDIRNGMILLETEGTQVGQVNGLSVLDMGDYSFGRPSRITARTFAGSGGVVHIERETDMADALHNKGLLTMSGYMGGKYAHAQPLAFSASITFEQNYSGVGGDSASSSELYCLLSSLSEVPIKQGIAVTGSINQRGEVQPIGGTTEKIEGFFRICQMNGLTGEQGVIIPLANAPELMLNDEVLAAVNQGLFRVWAIKTVDEGMEILTGVPAGVRDAGGRFPEDSIHGLVEQKLAFLASRNDDQDDNDSDGEENSAEIDKSTPAPVPTFDSDS